MVNTITKTALKLELKYSTQNHKLEELFDRVNNIVDTAKGIIYNIYPIRVKPKESDRQKYANSEGLSKYLSNLYKQDGYYSQYSKGISEIASNVLKIMHYNAEESYHVRSLPEFENLKDIIPVRISKFTPSWSKESSKRQDRVYKRDGRFEIKNNELHFRLKDIDFYVANKLNKEKFQMLADAIHGNGITIGDPCLLVRRVPKKGKYKYKPRYFLYVSISKQFIAPQLQDPIRIVGIDLGISSYLAVVSCLEYSSIDKRLKIINPKPIKNKQFIKLLDKYEEEKKGRMQSLHTKEGVKKGQKFIDTNKVGESLRKDYTRQVIHYTINEIIEFARENKANIIVVEDLKGLYKEKKRLKYIKKFLGELYNKVNKNGVQALNSIEINDKYKKSRSLKQELVEELKHINDKKKLLKKIVERRRILTRQINLLSYLPYYQFEKELENEAKWNGIDVKKVKASDTSITCIKCCNRDKHNRITRSLFRCNVCKFEMHADSLASINIALRGLECITNVEELLKLKGSRSTPSRQERAGGRMSEQDITSSLSMSEKPYRQEELRRLNSVLESSNPNDLDEGVHHNDGLTEGSVSVTQGLVSRTKIFDAQRGNGG